jgi:hypothetical protein
VSDPQPPTIEDLADLVAEVERHRLTVVCQPDVERLLAAALDRLGFDYPLPNIVVDDNAPDGTVYVFNPAALTDYLALGAPKPPVPGVPPLAPRGPFASIITNA